MNLFYLTFSKFFLLILSFCWVNSATAKEVKWLNFYYSVDGQIYKGKFKIKYSLITPTERIKGLDIIDFRKLGNTSVRAKLELSKLQWSNPSHAAKYKLVFKKDMIESGEGIIVDDQKTKEFFSKESSISIDFDIKPGEDFLLTGIFAVFFVLQRGVDINDLNKSNEIDKALKQGKLVGFQMEILPLLILPNNYIEDENLSVEEFYGFYNDILQTSLEKEGIPDYSEAFATEIRHNQYTSITKYFDTNSSSNSRVFSNDNKIVESAEAIEIYNPDLEAFTSARNQNTITTYRQYIDNFPNGKYIDVAEHNIVKLMPLKLKTEEKGNGIYTIRFLQGVGHRKPDLQIENNGDRAIKYQWESNKTVHFDLPEERQSEAIFKLYDKEISVHLNNLIPALNATFSHQGDRLIIRDVQGGKAPYILSVFQNKVLQYKGRIQSPEEENFDLTVLQSGSFQIRLTDIREETIYYQGIIDKIPKKIFNRLLRAILLAIPAVGMVSFLLYKKIER